jgi:hypothetical protein
VLYTNLFMNDRRNLLIIQPRVQRRFSGFLTAFTYCKFSGSFFCAHVEQLFAPFYNSARRAARPGGRRRDLVRGAAGRLGGLERFFVLYAAAHYKLNHDAISADERALLLALMYAKRAFIDPRLMMACGIRVLHIEQPTGDVVLGDGDVVHLGCCTDSHAINAAINFMPVTWIVTGLPRLLQWTE